MTRTSTPMCQGAVGADDTTGVVPENGVVGGTSGGTVAGGVGSVVFVSVGTIVVGVWGSMTSILMRNRSYESSG
jgi:outer membrane lipoprotein SlyB